jgi:hypothetical protein
MKQNKDKSHVRVYKDLPDNRSSNWDVLSVYGYGYGSGYYYDDIDTRKDKRKHTFSPVLLINTTVYDCEHCKRKKEDCKSEYCEDEDSQPDTGWDIGGW